MFSKIVNWFDKSDDKFIAGIRDERSRDEMLDKLRKARMLMRLLGLILAIGMMTEYSLTNMLGATQILSFFLSVGISLDTDNKIKMILLYQSKAE